MTLITDDPRDAVGGMLEDQTNFLLLSAGVQQNNVVPRQEGKGKAIRITNMYLDVPEHFPSRDPFKGALPPGFPAKNMPFFSQLSRTIREPKSATPARGRPVSNYPKNDFKQFATKQRTCLRNN